jgi:F-type H+-transporting ATPase subunit b
MKRTAFHTTRTITEQDKQGISPQLILIGVVEPRQRAMNILDALPGNSYLTKTGFLTVGIGAATFLISKEIYVLNEETLVLASFSGLIYQLIKTLRGPYNEWAEEQIAKMKGILESARQAHKSEVATRMDQVGQLKDVEQVTRDLFAMSKEIAEMDALAFELKQKAAVVQEVKSVLDSWVRYESALREREQRLVAEHVMAKVMQRLVDPKLQKDILAQSLVDVERAMAKA